VPGIDTSIYSWEHEIFTRTHFVGIKDPLPQRIGFCTGSDVVVPDIRPAPPPLRLEQRAPGYETDDHPLLMAAGYRIKDAHLDTHGEGTRTGNRAVDLITKLGQLRTPNEDVLSPEGVADSRRSTRRRSMTLTVY